MFKDIICQREYEIRVEIFEAMNDLLRAYSFSQLTVREISRIAEISRSTFYRYFKDKYAVVEWAMKFYMRQSMMTMVITSTWEENFLATLYHMKDHRDFYRKAYSEVDGEAIIELNVVEIERLFAAVLYDYRKVKRDDMLDFQIRYIAQAIPRMTAKWLLDDMPYPPQVMATYLTNIVPRRLRLLFDSYVK